jgi:histidinol-phosphate phosphatase family protein
MIRTIKDWNIDKSWTLFLDRDGVINERNFDGYITTPNQFKFITGVFDALNIFESCFGKIVLVTNQQGVAKEIMSECNLNDVHRYMCQELQEKIGFEFDAIYAATNFKGAIVDRRKPSSAMAMEAKEVFPSISFQKSIMIGDTDGDLKFGTNLGMKTVLIKSSENVSEKADVSAGSLKEFALMMKEL